MRKSRFREEQMVKILREANAASVPCSTSPSKAIADAAICERMRAIAAQYSRYGHRFVRIFLEPEGHRMSFTRAYRLWNAAGLQVPRKRLRRRWPRRGRAHCRLPNATTSGLTTSSSTPAPTDNSSSA